MTTIHAQDVQAGDIVDYGGEQHRGDPRRSPQRVVVADRVRRRRLGDGARPRPRFRPPGSTPSVFVHQVATEQLRSRAVPADPGMVSPSCDGRMIGSRRFTQPTKCSTARPSSRTAPRPRRRPAPSLRQHRGEQRVSRTFHERCSRTSVRPIPANAHGSPPSVGPRGSAPTVTANCRAHSSATRCPRVQRQGVEKIDVCPVLQGGALKGSCWGACSARPNTTRHLRRWTSMRAAARLTVETVPDLGRIADARVARRVLDVDRDDRRRRLLGGVGRAAGRGRASARCRRPERSPPESPSRREPRRTVGRPARNIATAASLTDQLDTRRRRPHSSDGPTSGRSLRWHSTRTGPSVLLTTLAVSRTDIPTITRRATNPAAGSGVSCSPGRLLACVVAVVEVVDPRAHHRGRVPSDAGEVLHDDHDLPSSGPLEPPSRRCRPPPTGRGRRARRAPGRACEGRRAHH